jgi:hypothetical protein
MKDYVARSYGHTPRKLPLKGVPLRATSRFIAYQALLLYNKILFLSIAFQFFSRKNNRISSLIFVHSAQIPKISRHPAPHSPLSQANLRILLYFIANSEKIITNLSFR